MRALIRVKLHPFERFNQLWDVDNLSGESPSTDDYEREIRQLLRRLHYDVFDICQEDMDMILNDLEHESKSSSSEKTKKLVRSAQCGLTEDNILTIKDIIREIPQKLRDKECRRAICLGYSSEGQAPFIVFAVNIRDLHIRIRGGLFGKTERACKDIILKAAIHRKINKSIAARFGRLISGQWRNFQPTYLTIQKKIEVMEPNEPMPTIVGTVIESVWAELYSTNRREVLLSAAFFFVALILVIFTPTMAVQFEPIAKVFETILKSFINPRLVPSYEVQYISSALERTYSALFVSSLVSFATLLTSYVDIKRNFPIKWVMDIEEN